MAARASSTRCPRAAALPYRSRAPSPWFGDCIVSPMEAYICRTCGVQQAESEDPPSRCAICDDERQYVPPDGQRWVTLTGLRGEGYRVEVRDLEPGLTGIGANPPVGIGQRALLVQPPPGNVLRGCFGFIDPGGIAAARARGEFSADARLDPPFCRGRCAPSPAFHRPTII